MKRQIYRCPHAIYQHPLLVRFLTLFILHIIFICTIWQVSENMLTTEKQKEINSNWFLKHELKENASHALYGLEHDIESIEV